jgi:hypothetical protein
MSFPGFFLLRPCRGKASTMPVSDILPCVLTLARGIKSG